MIERIEQLHHAQPFRPFKIELDDGREIVIQQPEFLGRFPSGKRIFFSTPEDTTEQVDVARVRNVAPVRPRRGSAGRHGGRKGRRG